MKFLRRSNLHSRDVLSKAFWSKALNLKSPDRKEFRNVVIVLFGASVAILTSSIALGFSSNLRLLLGVWTLFLAASLVASLQPTISVKSLFYIGMGIPLVLTLPLIILTSNILPAFQIGLTTALVLFEGTVVYFIERKHPKGFSVGELVAVCIIGIVISHLVLPFGFVYRTIDNPGGLLDPWSTVTVYGNDTTGSAGEKLVFTSLSHQNFSTSISYTYSFEAYAISLPNRMNYTISAPGSSPSACSPLLVLNVDSNLFAFNFKC